MKKFIARLLAFFLDLFILTLVVGVLSDLPFFDKYNNEIYDVRKNATRVMKEYQELDEKIDDILDDALVNDEEFNYIHTNFMSFRIVFDDIKPNVNISKEFIDNVHDNIDEAYRDMYNEQLFSVAKNSRYQNIIAIVVFILYFGVLQYFLKGQTIFKKLFKIKVVDNKDRNKRVPLWKYIIRAILICDIIFTIADLIAISNLGLDGYLTFNGVLGNIKYFYEVIFILLIFMRDDQRSVHDLILNTKIIRYNKDGKIMHDLIFEKLADDKSNEKSNDKLDTKKPREEVEAIKVND